MVFHNFYNFNLIKNFVPIINMLFAPKIDDYFEILTDEEVKDSFFSCNQKF